MKMNTSRNLRISRLAPAASLAALVISALLVANPKSGAPEIKSHHANIAKALDDFPYALGSWVGVNVDLPTAALEILRPNGFVSRRYSQMGKPNFITLGIVHCQDVRDMHSHYPPRCYPAAGWSQDGAEPIEIAIENTPTEMYLYKFKRVTQTGLDEYISVVSVFVAPDAGMLTSMDALEEIGSSGKHTSALGVAQIQLVFTGTPRSHEVQEQANDLFMEFPPMIIANFTRNPLSSDAKADSIVN